MADGVIFGDSEARRLKKSTRYVEDTPRSPGGRRPRGSATNAAMTYPVTVVGAANPQGLLPGYWWDWTPPNHLDRQPQKVWVLPLNGEFLPVGRLYDGRMWGNVDVKDGQGPLPVLTVEEPFRDIVQICPIFGTIKDHDNVSRAVVVGIRVEHIRADGTTYCVDNPAGCCEEVCSSCTGTTPQFWYVIDSAGLVPQQYLHYVGLTLYDGLKYQTGCQWQAFGLIHSYDLGSSTSWITISGGTITLTTQFGSGGTIIYSAAFGGDCCLSYLLTQSGGTLYPDSSLPSTVTIIPDCLPQSGSGSGAGDCTTTSVGLGTADSDGDFVPNLSRGGITASAGDILLVDAASVGFGLIENVTIGGAAFTQFNQGGWSDGIYFAGFSQWHYIVPGSVSGSIVVDTGTPSGVSALMFSVVKISGLTLSALDTYNTGAGSGANPTASAASTAIACEFGGGAFLMSNPGGLPIWGPNMSSGGQDVSMTVNDIDYTLSEGYGIYVSSGATATAFIDNLTPDNYAGGVILFK